MTGSLWSRLVALWKDSSFFRANFVLALVGLVHWLWSMMATGTGPPPP
jgi:hypothetical protein